MQKHLLAMISTLVLIAGCGGISSSPPLSPPPPTANPDVRAAYLVSQMTQAEKLQLVHGAGPGYTDYSESFPLGAGGYVPGIPRLGIPNLYFADGSVGVGNGVGQATALPSSIADAATWDLTQAYNYGEVIGRDLRDYGINVNLGGNINLIGREPRDGRTFETAGEDPLLAGSIKGAQLKAVQDQYVIADIKHFALNDQETGRTQANVLIDDRSARESDLLAFEIGLHDSDAQSVMCSYNLVNGTYSCENPYLLSTVLKVNWAFPGFVMSDWWATHSTVASATAGLDLEQPNSQYFGVLGQSIGNGAGQVPESRLDDMVQRILRAMFAAGVFDHPATPQPLDIADDDTVAQTVEEQGAVLLENNGILPLNSSTVGSIAVIGSHADIGVLSGGGSAQVIPNGGPALTQPNPNPPGWAAVIWDPSSPLQAIQAIAPGATIQFNDGSNASSAASLAASSNVAIVFVSQWASEGMDLPSLNFTDLNDPTPIDEDALVEAVAAANPRTIVVMENGGAAVMPWLNQVAAVLEAWYPGERGGPAIANLLFGAVDPSGKLPITFPASTSQLPRPVIAAPVNSTSPFNVDYTIDGLNVGYKWYDVNNLQPEFPFGFGLSYTTFAFSNQALINNLSSSDPKFQVTFNLTNTGSFAGADVAQVYLGLPPNIGEPPKRLVGFEKILLNPGQSQAVTIEVDENDISEPMSYWNEGSQSWSVASGVYTVYLGDSERNTTTVGTFTVGP